MRTFQLLKLALPALALVGLLSAAPSRADLSASAQITDTQISPGEYQYDITLNDIGTTNVGTLWFSWVPGADFMGVSPTAIVSPTGWTEIITHGGAADGFAIQWIAAAPDVLTAGNSLSGFQFDSTMTPAQLAGNSPFFPAVPTATSFAYIGHPFADPGEKIVASVTPTSTPEPGSIALAALAFGALTILRRSFAA